MERLADVIEMLPPRWRVWVGRLPADTLGRLSEIRLRVGRPTMVLLTDGSQWFVTSHGLSRDVSGAISFEREDADRLLQLLSYGSVYALEEQLQQGYLTMSGGHRVGFCGEVVMANGRLRTLAHVGAFNIRIARAVIGCADPLLPSLIGPGDTVRSTLIVSPPGCGKTTLLREIARCLSYGTPWRRRKGITVGIVDERSEIAACYHGVPRYDVGPRTDVVDKAPKAVGMMQLLRSMAPEVIITDEIGRTEDVTAIKEMLHAGVSVIASVHGASWEDICSRPALQPLLQSSTFGRVVILSSRKGPGTIESVFNPRSMSRAMHKARPTSVHMA